MQAGLNELRNELSAFTQINYNICESGQKQVAIAMSRDQVGARYNTFALFVEWQQPGQSANQRAGLAQYFFNGTYTVEFGRVIVDAAVGKCTLADGSCVDATQRQCVEELCGYWSFGPDCDPYKPSKYCLNYDPSDGGTNPDWIPEGDGMTYDECQASCTNTRKAKNMTTTTTGPGTELANLLKWFNIHAKEGGCGCKSMEKKMNRGPQWCRDHKDEILAHLEKEAKKRNLPFIRIAAEKLVNLAIRRAEKRP